MDPEIGLNKICSKFEFRDNQIKVFASAQAETEFRRCYIDFVGIFLSEFKVSSKLNASFTWQSMLNTMWWEANTARAVVGGTTEEFQRVYAISLSLGARSDFGTAWVKHVDIEMDIERLVVLPKRQERLLS